MDQQVRENLIDLRTSDNLAYKFPVSIKAVIFIKEKVILLENERNEFELPGGKLEIDEQPVTTLLREIKEELSVEAEVLSIVDSWLYHITHGTHVVIITYLCNIKNYNQTLTLSSEHKRLGLFTLEEILKISIPRGYINSINMAKMMKESLKWL